MTLKIPGLNRAPEVPVENIIRVEASSNYSRIYFSNGKVVLVAKVLHWFEEVLPPDLFIRVNRSHLVNRAFVQEVSQTQLTLCNGKNIKISRRKVILLSGYFSHTAVGSVA